MTPNKTPFSQSLAFYTETSHARIDWRGRERFRKDYAKTEDCVELYTSTLFIFPIKSIFPKCSNCSKKFLTTNQPTTNHPESLTLPCVLAMAWRMISWTRSSLTPCVKNSASSCTSKTCIRWATCFQGWGISSTKNAGNQGEPWGFEDMTFFNKQDTCWTKIILQFWGKRMVVLVGRKSWFFLKLVSKMVCLWGWGPIQLPKRASGYRWFSLGDPKGGNPARFSISSWWLNQPIWKIMPVKMGIFPRDENWK